MTLKVTHDHQKKTLLESSHNYHFLSTVCGNHASLSCTVSAKLYHYSFSPLYDEQPSCKSFSLVKTVKIIGHYDFRSVCKQM